MTERDLKNLDFIMHISEANFDHWLKQASDDDIEYALELIRQAKKDYMLKELKLMDSEDIDVTEAKQVIERIKGK